MNIEELLTDSTLNPKTLEYATQLDELLPDGLQDYLLSVDNGSIVFRWHRNKRNAIAVRVSPEGMLYYEARLTGVEHNGGEEFKGVIPPMVLGFIQRVVVG